MILNWYGTYIRARDRNLCPISLKFQSYLWENIAVNTFDAAIDDSRTHHVKPLGTEKTSILPAEKTWHILAFHRIY